MSSRQSDGGPTRRGPGRPRSGTQIDRRAIGEVALAILREEGVGGLTISAVAQRLGVRSQSLYHHVRSLAEVVDAARAILVSAIDLSTLDPDREFLAGVQEYAAEYFRAFLPVSRTIWLFFQHPIRDPGTLAMYERFLVRAVAAGLDEDVALTLMLDIEYAVLLVVYEHESLKEILPDDALAEAGAPTLRAALARMSPDTLEGSRRRLAARVRDLVEHAG